MYCITFTPPTKGSILSIHILAVAPNRLATQGRIKAHVHAL